MKNDLVSNIKLMQPLVNFLTAKHAHIFFHVNAYEYIEAKKDMVDARNSDEKDIWFLIVCM